MGLETRLLYALCTPCWLYSCQHIDKFVEGAWARIDMKYKASAHMEDALTSKTMYTKDSTSEKQKVEEIGSYPARLEWCNGESEILHQPASRTQVWTDPGYIRHNYYYKLFFLYYYFCSGNQLTKLSLLLLLWRKEASSFNILDGKYVWGRGIGRGYVANAAPGAYIRPASHHLRYNI